MADIEPLLTFGTGAGIDTDRTNRHMIWFDSAVHRDVVDHFNGYIDRRGTGRRGYGPWLMAAIDRAVTIGWVPDEAPDIRLDLHVVLRWPPGLHDRLKAHWSTNLADRPPFSRGHSWLVNAIALRALEEAAVDKARQGRLFEPGGLPRRPRVAHHPPGWPDKRGF